MIHLADTHIAIWWMVDDERLTRPQTRVLNRAQRTGRQIGLSAISLWEVAMLASRGRLRLTASLDELLDELASSPLFELLPLTPRIAADSTRLGADFPSDPADRLIAATARCHELTLLTADERIADSGTVTVLT